MLRRRTVGHKALPVLAVALERAVERAVASPLLFRRVCSFVGDAERRNPITVTGTAGVKKSLLGLDS